jgi:2-isopropylmalate synthase
MPSICKKFEEYTNMQINDRQPYAGKLVFAAFSGSHQDAIAKGMNWKEEKGGDIWNVPYLPIDPQDVGREYDADVIRINSQSGKGGVGYILEKNYGIQMPQTMKEAMGYLAKGVSDREQKELTPERIYQLFKEKYIKNRSQFDITSFRFKKEDGIIAKLTLKKDGETTTVKGKGNGRLEAVNKALEKFIGEEYELNHYEQHALERGASSKAIAYVGLSKDGKDYWGAGVDEDIVKASVNALVAAVNNMNT